MPVWFFEEKLKIDKENTIQMRDSRRKDTPTKEEEEGADQRRNACVNDRKCPCLIIHRPRV